GAVAVRVRRGVGGRMKAGFVTAVGTQGGPGATIHTAAGPIPPHVNPPAEPAAETNIASAVSLASAESKSAYAPRSSVQVASAVPGSSGGVGSFFSSLFGSKTEDQGAASRATQPADASASKSKTAASAPKRGQSAAGTARAKSEPPPAETKTANAATTKPSPSKQDAEPQKDTGNTTGLLSGAAPTMPSGGFDSRFGAWN